MFIENHLASDLEYSGKCLAGWVRAAAKKDIGFEINPYNCSISCDQDLGGVLVSIGVLHDQFATASEWFTSQLGVGGAAILVEKGEAAVTFRLASGPFVRIGRLATSDHPDYRDPVAI